MNARRGACALLVFALACASSAAQAGKPLISDKDLERLNRNAQLLGGVLQSFRQNRTMTPVERQRWAYGVVQQPQLDGALDRVLQEIRRAAGPRAPAARVYVIPDPTFQAYAAEDGSIFVAAGMLQSLESQDEIAALLAHEYVHVLRKHPGKSALETAKGVGAGLTSIYLDREYAGVSTSRPSTDYVRHALLRETAMQSVQAGIVPTRARAQEDEADRLGTDLMVAAGYNPIAMMDMLGRMELWEQQSRQAGTPSTVMQQGVAATLGRYLQNSDQARSAKRRLDDNKGVDNLITALVGATQQRVHQAGGNTHRDSAQRIERVRAHIETKHADLERPDMRALSWAGDTQVDAMFASMQLAHQVLAADTARLTRPQQDAVLRALVRSPAAETPLIRYTAMRLMESQMDRDKALPVLQGEIGRNDSLFALHQLTLDMASRSSNREQALQVLETSRKSLGDPPELLPYGVRLNRRAGKADAARLYAARCAGSGDDRLKRACQDEL